MEFHFFCEAQSMGVLGLKREDIDLERSLIRIRRNVTHPTRNLAVVGDAKTRLIAT